MNILVSWSSGLDSTYMIYKALSEGHNVLASYTMLANNSEKSMVESQQVNRLSKLFERDFPKTYKGVIKENIFHMNQKNSLIFKQIPIWITSLLYTINSDIDEVYIGIVLYDDTNAFKKEIRKIWKSYQSIISYKLPKLRFPIHKMDKVQFTRILPKEYLQNVFYCEHPIIVDKTDKENIIYKPCHKCTVCRDYDYYPLVVGLEMNTEEVKKELIEIESQH